MQKNMKNMSRKHTYTFKNFATPEGVGTILLYGEIGDGEKCDPAIVVSNILYGQGSYKELYLRVNSPGGDVFAGMAIRAAMLTSPANITVYIDGYAASMAAIIALSAKKVMISPYGKIMLHAVSGGAKGNAADLESASKMMRDLEDDLAKIIAQRCKMTAEEVKTRYMDGTDHWLSAQEALSMGLVDGIYAMDDTLTESEQKDIYAYFNNRLESESQTDNNMALLDDLKSTPMFANCADEKAVVDKAKNLSENATKIEALENANKSLKAKLEASENKEIEIFLASAVKEGKIKDEQKETYKALMKSDRKNTEALINSIKPQKAGLVTEFINQGSQAQFENKDWDTLDKEGKLSELKATNLAKFKELYKEKFSVEYTE